MSKITIIDGDYIETTGGKNLNYAKEGIEFTSDKEVIFTSKEGLFYGKPKTPPVMGDNSTVFYETDGHYSTVYLVCLMLGMNMMLRSSLLLRKHPIQQFIIKWTLNLMILGDTLNTKKIAFFNRRISWGGRNDDSIEIFAL